MWEGAQRLLGGFYHTRWFVFQGMLQKMGCPEVPEAGELKRACRTFQSCHREVQTRVSILQSKFMNSHQEMKKRINEKDTKLINTEKKKKNNQIQMPAGKFLSNVQMLSAEVFRWLTGLIRRGRCEWEQPQHRLCSAGYRIHRCSFISIISPLIGKTAAITSTLKDTSINIYHE